ncbi:MAG: hypothetical protein MPJ50_11645 [Pirellulales bacterium]|nr:hypothetical protein [Pirellulales bacterium]
MNACSRLTFAGGISALAVFLMVGATVAGHGQGQQQVPLPDVSDRVTKLEQRVTWLEEQLGRLCVEDAALAQINAEHKLSIAEDRLAQSERLAAQGYISDVQLQADQLAVEIARRELQLTKSQSQSDREAARLAVLNAEAALSQALLRYDHTQRLQTKGYVSEVEAARDKADVARAEKVLAAAKLKLEMYSDQKQQGSNPPGASTNGSNSGSTRSDRGDQ